MEMHFEENGLVIRKGALYEKLNSLEDPWKIFHLVKNVLGQNRYALLFLYIERPSTWEALVRDHSEKFDLVELAWVMEHIPSPIDQQNPYYESFSERHQMILHAVFEKEIEIRKQLSLEFLKKRIQPGIPIKSMQMVFSYMLDTGLKRIANDATLNP